MTRDARNRVSVEVDFGNHRGQLMLVGAIVMALVVISTVVLLNGMQVSEHTGSADTLRATDETAATTETIRTNVRTLFGDFQTNGGPYITDSAATIDDFGDDVTLFNRTYLNVSGFHQSSFVDVTVDDARTQTGTVLRSDGGTFESEGGAADWTVASGVERMPYFALNVTDQSTNPGTHFTVRFEDSADPSDYTELRFTDDEVQLDRPGLSSPRSLCSDDTDGSWTRLTILDSGGRLQTDGAFQCDGFSVEFDSPTDILVRQGAEAQGTLLTTVGTTATIPTGNYEASATRAPGSTSPYYRGVPSSPSEPVIINPAVAIAYDSPDIAYETTVYAMGRNIDT